MEKPPLATARGREFSIGLWLTGCSAALFSLPLLIPFSEDQAFGLFVGNYILTIVYFFTLVFSGRLKKGHGGGYCFLLFLILSLISAYSLNRVIPVFERSAGWLTVLLVIVSLSYIATAWIDKMPARARSLVLFVAGVGLALFLYLAIYLVPMYGFSLVGAIFLGFSLHAFVPALLVIAGGSLLVRLARADRANGWSAGAGAASAILVAVVFAMQWNSLSRTANRGYQQTLLAEQDELPAWIKVAQQLPDNWVTEKFLKAGLVYSVPAGGNDFFEMRMPSRNFDEVRKHDPLVMIAALFSPVKSLSEDERIKLLAAGYNARHHTQDRLWNGEHLTTTAVISNLRIWPQYRMAYTEKTITVASSHDSQAWRGDEEAIYTFHLPEGGVVTSLSLWIGGVEEKGILTTRGKADTAYRQIVGVERHDPSVVRWQEGNTVSVRVFPVPAGGTRNFKIGITAPLTLDGKDLRYDNIYFDGPDAAGAKEIVQVAWAGAPPANGLDGFEKTGAGRAVYEGDYNPERKFGFADPGLSDGTFSFAGATYGVRAYHPAAAPALIRSVYLDINEAWSGAEADAAFQSAKGWAAFVWDDGLVPLSDANLEEESARLRRNHFSLFPLYEIAAPESALLVTKCSAASPDVSDLKGTPFAARLEPWLQRHTALKLYSLDDHLSPYLKTLKEHRCFRYEAGDAGRLRQIIAQQSFAAGSEDSAHVVIDNAGMTLIKTTGGAPSAAAPDHLMRLFAYNHVMQQLRGGVFSNHEGDTALVAEAQQAYVVSPLSSLIVLETAQDYERFNIKDGENSLKNASLKSKGAVPEPNEWALIGIAALLMIGLRRRYGAKTPAA